MESAIESGLLRSYRDGRKAFAQARREPSIEALHTWRKRVKDLWYHERLLAPACGRRNKGARLRRPPVGRPVG